MDDSPLKTVVVPAVFVSSLTFSALTLPFALLKSEPLDIELPPFFKGEIQPMFDGEHNDKAISYVGFAIVASVAAGIASVEMRRKHSRNSPQPEAPLSNRPSFSTKKVQLEATTTPMFEQDAVGGIYTEDNVKSQSWGATAINADDSLDFAALVQAFDTVQQVEHLPISESMRGVTLSTDGSANASVQSGLSRSSQRLQYLNLESGKISELSESYQTCRIQVPGHQQSLLAITVENQHYSLFKAEKTREDALEVMAKLGQLADKMIVTKTSKSYAIWDLMPEAIPVTHNL